MPDNRISVVLADDHAVLRTGLKAVLGTAADIEVVGEAGSGREALALAERLRPDVLVMDLTMEGDDGLATTREIVARGLPSRVLIVTMHPEEDRLLELIEAGAAGYLVKSVADRELVDAVHTVARGDVYVRRSATRLLTQKVARRSSQQADDDRYSRLTQRERDVLRLTAQGYSGPEIGERLCISPKTVDTYRQRIQEKLGISHRSEYVQFALRRGLLSE